MTVPRPKGTSPEKGSDTISGRFNNDQKLNLRSSEPWLGKLKMYGTNENSQETFMSKDQNIVFEVENPRDESENLSDGEILEAPL